jgi:hypothetical protein
LAGNPELRNSLLSSDIANTAIIPGWSIGLLMKNIWSGMLLNIILGGRRKLILNKFY